MKSNISCFFLFSVLFLNYYFSQAPNRFKYQSVARGSANELIENATIGLRISIRDQNPTGTIVFQETHTVGTNAFGLFTISIGDGNNLSGSIESVAWGTGSKYIQVEADFNGGTNYELFGTSELLSVPYALYSNFSDTPLMPDGESIGNTTFWNGSEWVLNSSNIYNAGDKIGIGNTAPLEKLDVKGNINISNESSFMIADKTVLWNKGDSNIFVGKNVGLVNTLGFSNSFFGFNSGLQNQVGSQNTFIGAETGSANIIGSMNTFLGQRAGFLNSEGDENTFIGAYSGQYNSSGRHNFFAGISSGNSNTSGVENTFLGAHAGYYNELGSYNTSVGNFSGLANTSGNNNTFLGYYADASSSNLYNSTALGAGAIVNADNSVVVGNSAVTSIGGQVGWSTLSDRRLKSGIKKSRLGLDFIMKLNPVTYTYTVKGQENILYTGLVAQEVELVLDELNEEFSGLVKPKSDADFYSVRYGEFVLPLINAVQEQQQQINLLLLKNEALAKEIERLNKILKKE